MNVLYVHDICKLREKEKETQKDSLKDNQNSTPGVFFSPRRNAFIKNHKLYSSWEKEFGLILNTPHLTK